MNADMNIEYNIQEVAFICRVTNIELDYTIHYYIFSA